MTAIKTKKRALSDILKEARDSFEYEAEGLKLEVADILIKKMKEFYHEKLERLLLKKLPTQTLLLCRNPSPSHFLNQKSLN